MAVNSYSTYKSFFQTLAANNIALQDFVLGDSQRIIGDSRSEISYPVLWLESPDMKVMDNKASNFLGEFTGAFSILDNIPPDDYTAQDAAMESTYQIALQAISYMLKNRRGRIDSPEFTLDLNSITLNPIASLLVDNCYGWRVEFRFTENIGICYDASKWN
jgi:hypothetical protein